MIKKFLSIALAMNFNLALADEVHGLITKQQFNEIFPLSNGEKLKKQYTDAYNTFIQEKNKTAAAETSCAHLLPKANPPVYWTPEYQKCMDKAAPEYEHALRNLNELRGNFQNCPSVITTDSHGKKIDFSGEAPKPDSIQSVKTLYTYENFAKTTPYFRGFLAGDRTNAKRELAAFLANVQQETTGLCFASETPFDILEKLSTKEEFKSIKNQQLCSWFTSAEDIKNLAALGITLPYTCTDTNISVTTRNKLIDYAFEIKRPKGKYCQWQAKPDKEQECLKSNRYYYGRGPIQLSYPYNYIAFGETDFVHRHGYNLYTDPGLVTSQEANQESRSSLLWGSALWFWMTPQPPKPSAHAVMTNQWQPNAADIKNNRKPGFGSVINIINGGLECGAQRGADKDVKAQNRINAYKRILKIIGAPADDNAIYPLDCKNSNNFTVQ